MNNRIIYITLILAILQSCGNRLETFNTSGIVPIKIDFNRTPVNIHDIGLIDSVKIISLNTPYDDIIIGEINRVIRFGDKVYLMDSWQTRSIFIFTVNGDFVNKISSFGQGPREYLELSDIFINELDSTFNIVDRINRRVLKFDLEGRDFLEVIQLPMAFSFMTQTNFGFVGFTNNFHGLKYPHHLWILDDEFQIKNSFLRIDEFVGTRQHASVYNFSKYKGSLYYIGSFFDYNIYSIKPDEITIGYIFDLGRLQLSRRARRNTPRESFGDLGRQYLSFYNFQKTENHLIVRVLHQGQMLLGVYNRNSGCTYIAELAPYEGRYFFGFGQIVSFEENAIYAIESADMIRRMWLGSTAWNNFEETHPEQIRNLRERFEYIDEFDNPFLIIYSIN